MDEVKKEDKKNFTCSYTGCKSAFNRPHRLAQHVLVHMNVKPFACSEQNCTKAYTSKSHLDRHIKTSHLPKENDINILYCCPKCLKKYVNRQNLKRHIKISHVQNNKPYSCDQCRVYFKKKHQLRAHMYIHNGIKSFGCLLCDKDFVTLYEKKKHMRKHKTYQCEHCNEKFSRWTELMAHKREHHLYSEYICHDCGKVFKNRQLIIRHVKKHMPNTPINIHFCPYPNCTRHYSRNHNLKQHIMSAHEHVTYDCPVCGNQFTTKASQQHHLLGHDRANDTPNIVKTLETGRQKRKDENSLKETSALKLAGIIDKKPEESKDAVTPNGETADIIVKNEPSEIGDDQPTSGI